MNLLFAFLRKATSRGPSQTGLNECNAKICISNNDRILLIMVAEGDRDYIVKQLEDLRAKADTEGP